MIYQEQLPSTRLAAIVKRYWSLEYDGVGAEPETILPDGCPELIFNLSDRFKRVDDGRAEVQPASLFAGQISSRITIRPTGKVKLFGVRFRPSGAFALCGFSAHELTDRMFDIESIFGRDGSLLEETINVASTFEARIEVFEKFVLNSAPNAAGEGGMSAVLDLITARRGNVQISRLASYLNRTERSLERSFRERVGLTPKMFARIVRFQNVVRAIESSSDTKMLDAALSFGYFDQSHMIRDFREFSGQSPSEYFNKTHSISALFTVSP
jgi:AraC-like DNA-binding protein